MIGRHTPAGTTARRRRPRPHPAGPRTKQQPTLVVHTTTPLTGLDVTRIFAACATHGYQLRVGVDIGFREGDRLLRTVIASYGRHAGTGWDASLTDEQTGEVVRWAADQARRLWPRLSSAQLSDYVSRYALPLTELDLDLDPEGAS